MILSDTEIIKANSDTNTPFNTNIISPFDKSSVQPNSYELHLDGQFMVINDERVSAESVFRRGDSGQFYTIYERDTVIIHPEEFMLASTVERVQIPDDLVAQVEGKSSWARMGLLVHVTAGFIDSGFRGNITLELKNVAPYSIELPVGDPIAQLVLHTVKGEVAHPYGHETLNSHYQGQAGVTGSRA